MSDKYYNTLKEYLSKQDDFLKLFKDKNISSMTFEEAVEDTCLWVCDDDNLPSYLLDKKYLDISWLMLDDDKILNMDDVWEYFKIIIMEK